MLLVPRNAATKCREIVCFRFIFYLLLFLFSFFDIVIERRFDFSIRNARRNGSKHNATPTNKVYAFNWKIYISAIWCAWLSCSRECVCEWACRRRRNEWTKYRVVARFFRFGHYITLTGSQRSCHRRHERMFVCVRAVYVFAQLLQSI